MSLAALLASRARVVADYDGASTPLRFGDARAEWQALETGAALLDTGWRSTLVATGSERAEFLHGQLSQDVLALGPGQGAGALLLTAQGHVVAILEIYVVDDEAVHLVVEAARLARTRERLEQFLIADDVELEPARPTDRFAVLGPRAYHALAEAGLDGVLSTGRGAGDRPAFFVGRTIIDGGEVLAYSRGDLRVPFVEIVAAGGQALWERLEAAGATPVGTEAFEIVRVESGRPRYGVDVDDERVALEARLEWAIHFRKGCYVGQEIIERVVSRGRTKRVLSLLGFERAITPSKAITSAVVSPTLGPIGFAYLDRDAAADGASVDVEADGHSVAARVLEWPRETVMAGRR